MITCTCATRNRQHRKSNMNGSDTTLLKGKCSAACQTDLTADEIAYLVSELEECRRKNKILSKKLGNQKDLKKELNTEVMISHEILHRLTKPYLLQFNLRASSTLHKKTLNTGKKRKTASHIRMTFLRNRPGRQTHLSVKEEYLLVSLAIRMT